MCCSVIPSMLVGELAEERSAVYSFIVGKGEWRRLTAFTWNTEVIFNRNRTPARAGSRAAIEWDVILPGSNLHAYDVLRGKADEP